jgi:type II secretory pathway pseudopilin PulG
MASEKARRDRGIIDKRNILISMQLAGQDQRGARGYAMAALLVAMAVMAILMTAAMPVWKQTAQREKEEELIFRGMQYAHAIGLFQRKYANAYPPTVDVLVEQRFLRKKYKDPITGEDFIPIVAGQGVPGSATPGGIPQTPGSRGGIGGTGGIGRGGAATAPTPGGIGTGPIGRGGLSPIGTPGAGGVGGVQGVTSKSKEKSIRLYNGRNHYNEWAFVYTPQQQIPGAGAPGSAVPGQPGGIRGQPGGQRPGQPGQRQGFPGSPFGTPGGPGTGPGRRGGGAGTSDPFAPQPIFPGSPRGRSGG